MMPTLSSRAVFAAAGALCVAMTIAAAPTEAEAAKFKKCGAMTQTMRDAHGFLKSHLNELKKFEVDKDRKRAKRLRRALSRKIDKLRIRCQPKVCKRFNSDDKMMLGGARPAIQHKRILVCSNAFQTLYKEATADWGQKIKFCHIVSTMAHELAHLVGMEMEHGIKRHNQGGVNDRVYRFDHFVRRYCMRTHRPELKRP